MFGLPPLPRTLDAAFRDCASAKASVRTGAIRDLLRHARGSEDVRARATTRLGELLAKDPDPTVRGTAATALGELDGREVLAAVLLAIEDESPFVRECAVRTVGELGDARAATRLARALGDPRPEVRYQSVIAYSRVASDSASIVDALVRALDDPDPAIRYIAIRVAEEAIDDGKTWPLDPLAAVLHRLVQGGDARCAAVAAIVLCKLGHAGGRDTVLALVRRDAHRPKCDPEDEDAALEVAGAIDLREAVPALRARAFGPLRWVRPSASFHALIGLARMGDRQALGHIERELESGVRSRVEAAVVAAGRARATHLRERVGRVPEALADGELVRECLSRLASVERSSMGPGSEGLR